MEELVTHVSYWGENVRLSRSPAMFVKPVNPPVKTHTNIFKHLAAAHRDLMTTGQRDKYKYFYIKLYINNTDRFQVEAESR